MNPPNHPNAESPVRIPDLMSEQDLATVTRNREHLLAKAEAYLASDALRSREEKMFAQNVAGQVHAARMAAELADFHEAAAQSPHQSDKGAAYHHKLAGYARQLEATSLIEIEYLTA